MKVALVIPCFNGSSHIEQTLKAVLLQDVPKEVRLEIVFVDDGSTDDTPAMARALLGDAGTVLQLPSNQGRSTARNHGALHSNADQIIFIDSDCAPTSTSFVRAHVDALSTGADVSFGELSTPGDRFWERLQETASTWRRKAFEEGNVWAFTTSNVAIRRAAFEDVGGFDEVFNRYGFEDRDFFARLCNCGARFAYTPEACVKHRDQVSLASVSRKMCEAGKHSAHLFHARHPDIYRRLAFSKLDCSLHPWLGALDTLLAPILLRLASSKARWLEWRWLPFQLRAFMARCIYGFCFLHGTRLGALTRSPSRDHLHKSI